VNTTRSLFLLSVFSALLLILAWPVNGLAPLLFVAFVPLLLMQHYAQENGVRGGRVFGFSYLTFLAWNTGTTWWVYNATVEGSIMAFAFNALFMAIVFQLFHITRKRMGSLIGYVSLPAYWIGFEYLHMQWDLSWPWLTLGNGFASWYKWVQWYEFTGVFGGTLWILLVNILVARALLLAERRLKIRHALYALLLATLPASWSLIKYYRYEDKGKGVEVILTQPNIDPYSEKFSGMPPEEQLARMLKLAAPLITDSTQYVVGPETALPYDHQEEYMLEHPDVLALQDFIKPWPRLKVIAGVSTSKTFREGEKLSSTARRYANSEQYYDAFNTSMQVDNTGKVQLYHKSKLVPGVEQMPYPGIFKFVEKFAIDLGGTVGSYGKQEERSVFTSPEGIKTGVPICYESIYGEFMAGYIRNGADFIFIITNDGWWGDTPGYRQHRDYARLRAIEERRSVARSANTGISCFINQRGDIVSATGWWEPAALRGVMKANKELTFYVKYGDYIAKFFSVLAIALLLLIFAIPFFRKKKRETA
jgi:apolipoprotein N-acyltransferase